MRDEDFEYFVSKFGEATSRIDIPAEAIEKWRNRLPDQLLTYWQEEGWCGYMNGLFWTVDPEDYEDLIGEWLEGTLLEQVDAFHVVGRTAFGALYVCGERSGVNMTISCPLNAIFALPKDLKPKSKIDLDWSVKSFIGLSVSECDLKDESGESMFARAVSKLGVLAPDEVFGFEPALVLGGKMRLENLAKLNLDVHLTILRQFASPIIPFSNIDIEKLIQP